MAGDEVDSPNPSCRQLDRFDTLAAFWSQPSLAGMEMRVVEDLDECAAEIVRHVTPDARAPICIQIGHHELEIIFDAFGESFVACDDRANQPATQDRTALQGYQ